MQIHQGTLFMKFHEYIHNQSWTNLHVTICQTCTSRSSVRVAKLGEMLPSEMFQIMFVGFCWILIPPVEPFNEDKSR